jgi:hypothetical protein
MQRVLELGPLTHRPNLQRLRVFPGFDYRCPVRNRLMQKMRQYHPAFPPRFFMGLGAEGDRYIPTPDQILDVPTPGAWYRIKKGETWWGVSKTAYGKANVKKGLLTMNKSSWNDHIDRKTKDWEAYKVKGLQATPDYSATNPHAPVGSGNAYPVAWIPPLTGEEPEQMGYQPSGPTTPTPVTKPPSSTTTYIPGPKGDPGPPGPPGDPGPPPSSSAIQSAVNQYFQANPPPGGIPGPPGDPGPPPSSSAIQSAVNQYFQANPPPGGVPGPPGQPGPPPSSGEIKSAVDQWMSANPPKVVKSGGGGDDKQLWTLPLAAMFAWLK